MILRRQLLGAATALALTGVIALPVQAQDVPEGYPADYAAIIEASRGESGLIIYSNAGRTQWEPFIALWNERYPWLSFEVLDINSGELVERYLAEAASGVRTADAMVHQSLEGWINLKGRDAIAEYVTAEAANLPAFADQGGGIYAMGIDTTSFVWNKMLLPEDMVPTSMADLAEKIAANPDVFNGKVVTYGPGMSAAGFTNHYSYTTARGDTAWAHLEAIGPAVRVESSAGPMTEKILAGEYVLGFFIATASVGQALSAPGADQVLDAKLGTAEDGVPGITRSVGITKAAASPNAARLFMDLLLSRDGQIALASTSLPYVREDITSADIGRPTVGEAIAEIGIDNILLAPISAEVAESREELLARLAKIYGTQ